MPPWSGICMTTQKARPQAHQGLHSQRSVRCILLCYASSREGGANMVASNSHSRSSQGSKPFIIIEVPMPIVVPVPFYVGPHPCAHRTRRDHSEIVHSIAIPTTTSCQNREGHIACSFASAGATTNQCRSIDNRIRTRAPPDTWATGAKAEPEAQATV